MATDLAEIVGGAVALNLLFGLPLVSRGAHHHRGVNRIAVLAEHQKPENLRARHYRHACHRHRRFPCGVGRLTSGPEQALAGLGAGTQRAPKAQSWQSACSARP